MIFATLESFFAWYSILSLIRAPRVYGPNEGSAATGAHGGGSRKRQNPQSFGLRAGGELAQQSGVNNQQKAAARSPRFARESWRPSSAPRDRSLAHRSLRTLRSSTLKNKTHRPPQQPPGGHPIRIVRSPEARTVARTGAMISEIHNLGDYLGEFW